VTVTSHLWEKIAYSLMVISKIMLDCPQTPDKTKDYVTIIKCKIKTHKV